MSGKNPVLLIHGIDDTARLFRKMLAYLERSGRVAQALDLIPNNGDAGLELLAAQVARHVDREFAGARAFDLVGFSMGGLVARYYAQRLDADGRVERLVTIGAPHAGTWAAYFRGNAAARQMRRGSAFLRDLGNDREWLRRVAATSIWTPFDLMIVPTHSARLEGARSVAIPVAAHPLMPRDKRVFRAVQEALDAGADCRRAELVGYTS